MGIVWAPRGPKTCKSPENPTDLDGLRKGCVFFYGSYLPFVMALLEFEPEIRNCPIPFISTN